MDVEVETLFVLPLLLVEPRELVLVNASPLGPSPSRASCASLERLPDLLTDAPAIASKLVALALFAPSEREWGEWERFDDDPTRSSVVVIDPFLDDDVLYSPLLLDGVWSESGGPERAIEGTRSWICRLSGWL